MGGFVGSKNMEDYIHSDVEYIPDRAYEHIEQCIVMTKVFEDADINTFFEFAEALSPRIKGMPSSLSLLSKLALSKFQRFSSEKASQEKDER